MISCQPKHYGELDFMFDSMEKKELKVLYVIGENPVSSEADQNKAQRLLKSLDCLVVQDVLMTETAAMADIVLPASAGWSESDGTVTSSERKVQRVRPALVPPDGVRGDIEILFDLAQRL